MTVISQQEIEGFSESFNSNPENKVASRAARRSGLLEASFNDRVSERLNHVFSTELDIGGVTDQKHSGRCWEFTTLNVLRHYFGKEHKLIISSGTRLNVLTLFTMQLFVWQINL